MISGLDCPNEEFDDSDNFDVYEFFISRVYVMSIERETWASPTPIVPGELLNTRFIFPP